MTIDAKTKPILKPCPFCDSADVRMIESVCYWVTCDTCDADGPSAPTAPRAALSWNIRPALMGQ